MRKLATTVIALIAVSGLILTTAPAASAAPDLAGKWKSAALKMDGVGYKMTVVAEDSDPANAYDVVLRFRYQDGTTGPRIKAGMIQDGRTLYMVLNGKGDLMDVNGPNVMKGSLGQDGSMFFPTCYTQLKFVTKKTADEGCLFQEIPSQT